MRSPKISIKEVKHPEYSYVVNVTFGGKRSRRYYLTESEAKDTAQRESFRIQNEGVEAVLDVSQADRSAIIEAKPTLEKHGKSVRDALTHFLQHLAATESSCSVNELIRELIGRKEKEGKSARYLDDLGNRLRRFGKEFGTRLAAEIHTDEVEGWLDGLGLAPTTVNNFRRVLHVLFNFAVDRGYARENPAKKTTKRKVVEGEIGILTVEQARSLLGGAPSDFVAIVAIGLFAGLRRSELTQLRWDDINLGSCSISVRASVAKSARRRIVEIQPNLMSWLKPHLRKPAAGLIVPSPDAFRKRLEAARVEAGIGPWPHNAMRHSFASYHLAHFKNAPALALQLGHTSPNLIFDHYREVVPAEQAGDYWGIIPAKTKTQGRK